ncbi:MAG TPA: hypothetical protein VEB18_03980 [Candidatus Paceibacterota bacterium]|nr:hypothetical protein [Candidatus Paceibacterota bacterium]
MSTPHKILLRIPTSKELDLICTQAVKPGFGMMLAGFLILIVAALLAVMTQSWQIATIGGVLGGGIAVLGVVYVLVADAAVRSVIIAADSEAETRILNVEVPT